MSVVAMLGKEWIEYIRTYKLFLLIMVFVLFAIMSPAAAYYMADILKSAGINSAALSDPMLQNPTYLASFQQFFKNVGQMGLLVLAIVFAGVTANDISKQTIVPLLAKGLKRDAAIYGKLCTAFLVWGLVYAVCVAVMLAYTAYYFDMQNMEGVAISLLGIFEFGLLLIVLLGLGGVMYKSQVGALVAVGVFILLLTLLSVFTPQLEYINPITMISQGYGVVAGTYDVGDFITSMWVGLGLVFIGCVATVFSFRKVQF